MDMGYSDHLYYFALQHSSVWTLHLSVCDMYQLPIFDHFPFHHLHHLVQPKFPQFSAECNVPLIMLPNNWQSLNLLVKKRSIITKFELLHLVAVGKWKEQLQKTRPFFDFLHDILPYSVHDDRNSSHQSWSEHRQVSFRSFLDLWCLNNAREFINVFIKINQSQTETSGCCRATQKTFFTFADSLTCYMGWWKQNQKLLWACELMNVDWLWRPTRPIYI